MSKNYDLYPKSERKIDNWRRRILGYEKMKRDLQRQIQILKNKNKKQKEVIDKAIEYIKENIYSYYDSKGEKYIEETVFERNANPKELLEILEDKEVLE